MKLLLILVSATLLTACVATDTIDDRQTGQQLVCHKGKETIAVSTAAMFAHEQHGDSLGPCPHGN
jgi:hypothetical protein